jgi:hypothetical protein
LLVRCVEMFVGDASSSIIYGGRGSFRCTELSALLYCRSTTAGKFSVEMKVVGMKGKDMGGVRSSGTDLVTRQEGWRRLCIATHRP